MTVFLVLAFLHYRDEGPTKNKGKKEKKSSNPNTKKIFMPLGSLNKIIKKKLLGMI